MKLTKKKLISIVKKRLEKIGFTYFQDSIFQTQGTFIIKLNEKLFLTLTLTIHRYYDSLFSADYYLSPTTRSASVWGDIPCDSYERVSFVLTNEERVRYSNEVSSVKDLWWDGFNDAEVDKFIEIVTLTYKRFPSNSDLIKRINQSNDVKKLAVFSHKTIETVKTRLFSPNLEYQPMKEVDGIPFDWFKAAETVIRNEEAILNINTVKKLAADAYRQFCLNQ